MQERGEMKAGQSLSALRLHPVPYWRDSPRFHFHALVWAISTSSLHIQVSALLLNLAEKILFHEAVPGGHRSPKVPQHLFETFDGIFNLF